MFYLNSIEQLENLVGLKEQLEVCLTCSRLLAAIQMLLLHQKLRCDSNKTTLIHSLLHDQVVRLLLTYSLMLVQINCQL